MTRWLKAAVHVHTTFSFDGHWDLPRVVAALRRRGYDAVLTAEHSQSLDESSWKDYQSLCAELSDEAFLVVPGLEYRDADNVVHIPTWGEDLPHLGDRVDVGVLLARVRELGGVSIWAHPGRRRAHERFEESWAPHLCGIEVWNRKYDGWQPGDEAGELARTWGLPAFASLDLHGRRQLFPLATAIGVTGPPTPRSVCDAIRTGSVSARFLGQPRTRWESPAGRRLLATADLSRRRTLSVVRTVLPGR